MQFENFDLYRYFVAVFNKIIIPLALVGHEMIIANSTLRKKLRVLLAI